MIVTTAMQAASTPAEWAEAAHEAGLGPSVEQLRPLAEYMFSPAAAAKPFH